MLEYILGDNKVERVISNVCCSKFSQRYPHFVVPGAMSGKKYEAI